MAGRQSHRKNVIRASTPTRYKGKLYGIFKNYMGEKYADQLVENMYNSYKSAFVDIYNKVHNAIRPLIVQKVGAGASFVLWQLVNEAIYAVYLTHKETASFIVAKYGSRGVPSQLVKTILAEVGNLVREIVPQVAQQLGDVKLDANNVVATVDDMVNKNPALPNSYAGSTAREATIQPTAHYEGTGTFSSYNEAYMTLEQILQEM